MGKALGPKVGTPVNVRRTEPPGMVPAAAANGALLAAVEAPVTAMEVAAMETEEGRKKSPLLLGESPLPKRQGRQQPQRKTEVSPVGAAMTEEVMEVTMGDAEKEAGAGGAESDKLV